MTPVALLAPLLALLTAGLPPVTVATFEPPADGFAAWGEPFGPDARACQLDWVDSPFGRSGRIRYRGVWSHVVLPFPLRRVNPLVRPTTLGPADTVEPAAPAVPAFELEGRPTWLRLRLRGDASGNLLGVNLIDATGEWFVARPFRLTLDRWAEVRLALDDLVDHRHGNDDGRLDAPVALLALTLQFAGRNYGEILLDDLVVEQTAWSPAAYVSLELGVEAPTRLILPEDRAPRLTVVNRGAGSREVLLKWAAPAGGGEQRLVVEPRAAASLPVALRTPGPQRLLAVARCGDEVVEGAFEVALLPPAQGGPDLFCGLGEYDAADLQDRRLLSDLPLLRAAGARWLRLALPARAGETPRWAVDWSGLGGLLSLARALDLRAVACWRPDDTPPDDYAAELAALDRTAGQHIQAWALPSEVATATLLADLTAGLEEPKPLLLEGSWSNPPTGAAGWLRPPRPGAATDGLPRALAACLAATEATGGTPVWLWEPVWNPVKLTGVTDPAAAAAIAIICARTTPGVVAAGWGQVHDPPHGLFDRPRQLRPELLAVGVANRLVGGLRARGLETLATGVYRARFAEGGRRVDAVWSEAEPSRTPTAGCRAAYDHLGRPLPVGETLPVGPAPIYLVGADESP